jgi:hypothetical protein
MAMRFTVVATSTLSRRQDFVDQSLQGQRERPPPRIAKLQEYVEEAGAAGRDVERDRVGGRPT